MYKRLHTAAFLFIFSLGLCLSAPAQAANAGLAQQIDWQSEWGDILPDTKIPSSRFNIKFGISRAVQLCGVSNDYSQIPVHVIDLNGDGRRDYVNGAYPFFTAGIKSTCPINLYSASGGYNISIYLHENVTQILEGGPSPACPATAAANTGCLSHCAATTAQCPHLFRYTAPLIWDTHVISWSAISLNTYMVMRAAALTAEGEYKYRTPLTSNVILRMKRGSDKCTLDERDMNNDGQITSNEPCLKYYQYYGGRLLDMYAPGASNYPNEPENDNRYTEVAFSRDAAMIDSDEKQDWRLSADGGGMNDLRIQPNAGFYAFQVQNYNPSADSDAASATPLMCREYANTSSNSYFIPTRTDIELDSFNRAAANGDIQGVTAQDCQRRFTPWVGTTACPPLQCGETITIAAERRCQRSSSAYGSCSECDSVSDPAPLYNSSSNKCFFAEICSGPPCINIAGGECLPATAEILMADGSIKKINEVKLGEMIMSFTKDDPLGTTRAAKVKTVYATDRQELMQINESKITKDHLVLKASGKNVPARKIKLGDMLVGKNGKPIKVTKLIKDIDELPVYNFTLYQADGYIVDGYRVMALPKISSQ